MDTIYMTSIERDDRLTALEVDVGRLVRIVDGENGDLSPGIVGILRRNTDKIASNTADILTLQRTIDRAKWTMAGFSAAGGLLGGALVYLITQIVTGNLPTP